MNGLAVHGLVKHYGGAQALRGVSFDVAPAGILALLGPSGCGKSTALRIVAGIEQPDAGDVLWDGASVAHLRPDQRGFGLMFQDYALFPHLDVAKNVAFSLAYLTLTKLEARARTDEMLALVGLGGFGARRVDTLSGGEQQRVALARALAPRPRLLMLDEPLGALDRALRERLNVELASLLRELAIPAVVVTHDQEEAFVFASEVAVMDSGRILRRGAARDVYGKPGYVEVAAFLGLSNLIPATVLQARSGQALVSTALGEFTVHDEAGARSGEHVTVLIRPDAAREAAGDEFVALGTVQSVTFRGARQQMVLTAAGATLEFHLPSAASAVQPGEQAAVALGPMTAQVLWPAPVPDEARSDGGTDQTAAGVRINTNEPERRPPARPV
jgi:ABC-type Fe3+/spermidine/putrescine transport system ATPase subunit